MSADDRPVLDQIARISQAQTSAYAREDAREVVSAPVYGSGTILIGQSRWVPLSLTLADDGLLFATSPQGDVPLWAVYVREPNELRLRRGVLRVTKLDGDAEACRVRSRLSLFMVWFGSPQKANRPVIGLHAVLDNAARGREFERHLRAVDANLR